MVLYLLSKENVRKLVWEWGKKFSQRSFNKVSKICIIDLVKLTINDSLGLITQFNYCH